MKKFFLFFPLVLLLHLNLLADEGMWLLPLVEKLNIDRMHQLGLKLTAEDIYSINHSSLKDAVVALDHGMCTAEFISAEGLLLTNHHCGFSEIQAHSTLEHDYLTNGFWAMTRDQELPNPGKTVTFLIRMEDVSDRINSVLTYDMSEEERSKKIKQVSDQIIKEAADSTNKYEAKVESFFEGNKFYLLVYQTYKDVRLVGAPPSSIGKFGGDTDNWMWPRHTGDFSLFRVYCAPDGSPAEYSPNNVPLKPKKFLPVSVKGIHKGDFTMILGYPGRTDRYLSSWGILETQQITNPIRIKVRSLKLDLWQRDMNADRKVKLQYADKYATSSNYYKYSIGQQRGLRLLPLIEERQALENEFSTWVAADPDRTARFGNALKLIQEAYDGRKEYAQASEYLMEALYNGIEIMEYSLVIDKLYMALRFGKDSISRVKAYADEIRKEAHKFYKDYSLETDKKTSAALLKLFFENVPPEFHPDIFITIQKKFKGDFNRYVNFLFAKTIFSKEDLFLNFLSKPDLNKLDKDPVIVLLKSFLSKYFEIDAMMARFNANLNRGQRLFLAGLMEMQKDRIFYPDANSTMRLTYGTVGDYKPMDAVFYDYKTTLAGIIEKEDPGSLDFVVEPKLKELFRKKDYGRYGENGEMPVCFISNNDITGGNSGSPVMNANGELVGIAFDGNWEGMTSDIQYYPEKQKTICVDIRYVLFIIDKLAGATHLLNEMQIVE